MFRIWWICHHLWERAHCQSALVTVKLASAKHATNCHSKFDVEVFDRIICRNYFISIWNVRPVANVFGCWMIIWQPAPQSTACATTSIKIVYCWCRPQRALLQTLVQASGRTEALQHSIDKARRACQRGKRPWIATSSKVCRHKVSGFAIHLLYKTVSWGFVCVARILFDVRGSSRTQTKLEPCWPLSSRIVPILSWDDLPHVVEYISISMSISVYAHATWSVSLKFSSLPQIESRYSRCTTSASGLKHLKCSETVKLYRFALVCLLLAGFTSSKACYLWQQKFGIHSP